ncbi:MAG: hypothetical protein ACE1Y8_02395, partial [Acidimicrobiia bacterium]
MTLDEFLAEMPIGDCPPAHRVKRLDGFTVGWRLGKSNRPRDDSSLGNLAKVLDNLVGNILGH